MGDDENASLDQFVGASDDGDADEGRDAADTDEDGRGDSAGVTEGHDDSSEDVADDGDPSPDAADDAVAEPAVTSAWAPAGRRCDRCGDAANRLWRADGETVCSACKEWT